MKKARILQCVHRRDAYHRLLADVLVRTVLHDQFQLPEEALIFGTNVYGKPYLRTREDIFFNLTHSGDWVGCIVGSSPVGIDIERIRSIDLAIAQRYFSTEEYTDLRARPEDQQLDFFYGIWTRKESYIKAIGIGLSLSLQSFTVRMGEESVLQGKEDQYLCKSYVLEEGYKMAACSALGSFPDKLLVADTVHLLQGTLVVN